MEVSVWKGGTYGIRVGRKNACLHFKKFWSEIEVKIDGKFYKFSISNTFWTSCPEFRGYPVPDWLKRNKLDKWKKGYPPKLILNHLEINKFELLNRRGFEIKNFISNKKPQLSGYKSIRFNSYNKTKRIVLISCASKKLHCEAKAKDLYISTLFKKSFKYALSLNPERIFILSAKYGLIDKEQEIAPYDKTLNKMPAREVKEWANHVIKQLNQVADLKKDNFIFLAGEKYRKYLLSQILNYEIPLKGLPIGKQLSYLMRNEVKAKGYCVRLHEWFNDLPRFRFPFDEKQIPLNGIYFLFQKDEYAHSVDRIVRIGTHTGKNRLVGRLKEHFMTENKDRSIFRKNIGRAILNKNNDLFSDWEIDLTYRESREKYSQVIDFNKQNAIEKEVSQHIQDNFSFSVLLISDKKRRLELESKIISTISSCSKCKASPNWLGTYSPKKKIQESGLWQEQHLYSEQLTDEDFVYIKKCLTVQV